METKPWYTSKTLYVNAIAIVAIVLQGVLQKEVISLELQATILAVINMLLRLITKKEVTW